jgi:hypothetical protein
MVAWNLCQRNGQYFVAQRAGEFRHLVSLDFLQGLITRDPFVGPGAAPLGGVACGPDNAVWHNGRLAPVGTGPVDSLGGVITSNIAMASNLDGRIEIFARGTNNALNHKWRLLLATVGRIGFPGRSPDQRPRRRGMRTGDWRCSQQGRTTPWHQRQVSPGSGSSGWTSLGGVITSQIALGQNADGR